MKNLFLALCFLGHFSVSHGQDCDTRLEYNELLKKRQVITTQYVALSTLLGSNLAVVFAKMEDAQERYVLNTEIIFGDPYVSNEQDSLVFQFRDGTKLKFVHGYRHDPKKLGIVNGYFCYHTFPVSSKTLEMLANKPIREVTLYITGTSGISFDHLSKREQRRYGKGMGVKTYDIRRISNRRRSKIQRLAACILQASVPTVEQTMSR